MEAAAAKPQGVVECDLCTMVLKYVDAVLTKNASEVCVASVHLSKCVASVYLSKCVGDGRSLIGEGRVN